MSGLDYDALSPSYGQRYEENPLSGVEGCLREIVCRAEPQQLLEVGCGTGRWLPVLGGGGARVVGIDPFLGMLSGARGFGTLVCADGDFLPFGPGHLDLLVSINAIHHLRDPEAFLEEAFRLLRPGGEIAIVHYDPSQPGQDWYVYDYFEGALADDLDRFPRLGRIAQWLRLAGFDELETAVVEVIERTYSGEEVLGDYFLDQASNSTLARLTRSAYEHGLEQLRRALAAANKKSEPLELGVRLELLLVTARRSSA